MVLTCKKPAVQLERRRFRPRQVRVRQSHTPSVPKTHTVWAHRIAMPDGNTFAVPVCVSVASFKHGTY